MSCTDTDLEDILMLQIDNSFTQAGWHIVTGTITIRAQCDVMGNLLSQTQRSR